MSNGFNAPYGLIAVESVSGGGATRKMKKYKLFADRVTGATTAPTMFAGDAVKFQPAGVGGTFIGGLNIVPALTPHAGPGTIIFGAFLGTFIGCRYTPVDSSRVVESNYWPGNNLVVKSGTEVIAYVNDDPNQVYKVQMSTSTNNNDDINGQTTSVYQDWMVGQNAMLQLGGVNFTGAGSLADIPTNNPDNGNALNSRSAMYLDGASINPDINQAGNPDFDVKILGLAPSASLPLAYPTAAGGVNLVLGVNVPFCDVLVKFNNHVFGSGGVAGPFNTN